MRRVWVWGLVVLALASTAMLVVGVRIGYRESVESGGDRRSFSFEFDPSISRLFRSDIFGSNTSEDAAASAEHWNIVSSIISCLKLPYTSAIPSF